MFFVEIFEDFTDLGKTRENVKVDGEVCSRNKDKFRCGV